MNPFRSIVGGEPLRAPFGLAPEAVGAVVVGVFDADAEQCPNVVVGQFVVNGAPLAIGFEQETITEKPQLVRDRRN